MSSPKTSIKPDFFIEYGVVKRKLETLERSFRLSSFLPEINTTGKTNSEIDEAVTEGREPPPNGKLISDPTNKFLLIRMAGIWRKTSVT
jgi:hypothetical protein